MKAFRLEKITNKLFFWWRPSLHNLKRTPEKFRFHENFSYFGLKWVTKSIYFFNILKRWSLKRREKTKVAKTNNSVLIGITSNQCYFSYKN